MAKYVYFFGGGKAEGKAEMKNLLGGKGANLAEMANLGLPVPPGFTITTEVCTLYYKNKGKYPAELKKQVEDNLKKTERIMEKKFGDPKDPLLVSVRSGARASMPGMMETILNVGLAPSTIPGLIAKTNNPRFVYDAYRRLIMMYSDVVMEKAAGIEPAGEQGIRKQLEAIMHEMKEKKGVKLDTELSADDLKELAEQFKARVLKVLGKPFPDEPMDQLWGSVSAVFQSWNGRRAVEYRRIEKIPDEWGTAVTVQTMVFGNTGDTSATGVGFTRDPATGRNIFYGEWLPNAQGEDVVAGIRTPLPVNEAGKTAHTKGLTSLEKAMPAAYKQLNAIQHEAREALPRHARHRVHHRGRPPVHAPVPRRQAQRRGRGEDRGGHGQREADQAGRGGAAHQGRRAGAVPAADGGPEGGAREQAAGQGPAGRSRRRARHGGLHRRRGRAPREGTPREGHPRPHRDQPGGRPRHARRAGDPHRQGRHDQPRRARRARLGQVLHRRLLRHRGGHGPQGPEGRRQGDPGRRVDHAQRHLRHGLRRQAAAGGPGPAAQQGPQRSS